MARYEYRCEDGGHTFEIQEPISEHGAGASPPCPECGSRETVQVMSSFYPDTSSKT